MDRYADEHAMNGYGDVLDGERYVDEAEEVDYGSSGAGFSGGANRGGAVNLPSEGKIFVGGVAWETSEGTITKHFEKYGAVTESLIMKDEHSGAPRRFGFITFADPAVISRVLQDEHVIDGRPVEVKRTVSREEVLSNDGPRTRKIFVGGLPASLTEDDLKDHFSSYGHVVEHQIMLDHSTGRSRGFGFVTFGSDESVEKVISEGRMRYLGGKQVEIKRAEPKRFGDSYMTARSSYGSGSFSGSYRGVGGGAGGGGGSSSSSVSSVGGAYGYGGNYCSAGPYYSFGVANGAAGYGYGGGYGYGVGAGYGSGYGSAYGGSIYGNAYGSYGVYSAMYGAQGGYGLGYGSYGVGRGDGRYHPYSK